MARCDEGYPCEVCGQIGQRRVEEVKQRAKRVLFSTVGCSGAEHHVPRLVGGETSQKLMTQLPASFLPSWLVRCSWLLVNVLGLAVIVRGGWRLANGAGRCRADKDKSRCGRTGAKWRLAAWVSRKSRATSPSASGPRWSC